MIWDCFELGITKIALGSQVQLQLLLRYPARRLLHIRPEGPDRRDQSQNRPPRNRCERTCSPNCDSATLAISITATFPSPTSLRESSSLCTRSGSPAGAPVATLKKCTVVRLAGSTTASVSFESASIGRAERRGPQGGVAWRAQQRALVVVDLRALVLNLRQQVCWRRP